MQTVPGIMTDVQKIKLARASGDKIAEDLARESFKTKLAQLEAQQYEKQYNTAAGELKKAYSDLRVAEGKIDRFKYQSDVDVAKIQGRFGVKQERVKARQQRKTDIMLQDDAQAWEKEFADYRANRALELAQQYGLSQQTRTDIIRALAGTDPQEEAVAIYEATIKEGDRGRDFWRAYNKIDDSEKSSKNEWEPPSLTQTQSNEIALNALAPIDRLPVKITDVEKWYDGVPFFGADEVQGTPASEEDYQNMATELTRTTTEAAKQGLSPNLMKSVIDNLRATANTTLDQYSDYLDEADGGIVFNDKAAKGLSQEEDLRNIILQIKQSIQINDFFESAAGKQYYNWVNESVNRSYQEGRTMWVTPQTGTEGSQTLLPRQPTSPTQPTQPTLETPETPETPQPESDGSSRLPSVSRENAQIQEQVSNLSEALDTQGWEVGDFIKYNGTGPLALKYMQVQPNMIFRIVGLASKEKDGYPADGVLVQGLTMPSLNFKDTTPEERNAARRISRQRIVIPFEFWKYFAIR